jgi:hypothetical protein
VIFLSETFKTALELIVCLFSCIGVIYLLQDLFALITKRKMKSKATVVLDLRNSDLSPICALLNFASFYHNSHASRYIQQILIIGAPEELSCNSSEISSALCIPIEFRDGSNIKI